MADSKEKVYEIADLLAKMDKNNKKVILQYIIQHDLKLYTDVLLQEKKRLEAECLGEGTKEPIPDVNMGARDGFLGFVGGEQT